MSIERISKEEAGRILCRYHNIDGAEKFDGKDGVRQIMQRICSIQYDPLNVVARNADLVLQARVDNYRQQDLYDLLYNEHWLIDGYDKEMCIYRSSEFGRFENVRIEHEKQVVGTLTYRNQLDALDILDDVRNHINKFGKTGTKDISIGEVRESRWGPKKLSSAALDYLFIIGEISVVEKKGTQKYFDMTKNILKSEYMSVSSDFTVDEFLCWYTRRRLQSVGLLWTKSGGAWQGHFLSDSKLRNTTLNELMQKNEIDKIEIDGINESFYISKDVRKTLEVTRNSDYARFIAPLDNMLWDRTMVQKIFDFEYRWEVYTPVIKRKYGYYVIPVVYNDRLIARFEPESLKTSGEFTVKKWWWEPKVTINSNMLDTIECEMIRFSDFLETQNTKTNMDMLISL